MVHSIKEDNHPSKERVIKKGIPTPEYL